MKDKILVGVLGLVLIGLLGVMSIQSELPTEQKLTQVNVHEQGGWKTKDCSSIIRAKADGTKCDPSIEECVIEDNGCTHNLLTDAGKNALVDVTFKAGTGNFSWIAMCNASNACAAPAAGDTTLENEFAACGLTRAAGTISDLGTGNVSIVHTFTSTCDGVETNKTGLFNNSAGDTLIAENTFTLATLQTNDQLTMNKTVYFT